MDWPRLDLGNLLSLRLHFNNPRMDSNTAILLPQILELPSLAFFRMEQPRHPEFSIAPNTPTNHQKVWRETMAITLGLGIRSFDHRRRRSKEFFSVRIIKVIRFSESFLKSTYYHSNNRINLR